MSPVAGDCCSNEQFLPRHLELNGIALYCRKRLPDFFRVDASHCWLPGNCTEEAPMIVMCDLYDVSTGGYYAWNERERSETSLYDQELLIEIRRVFNDSGETYGSPRVYQQLKREGFMWVSRESLE